jgi:phosphohistidine swiveling domain-containing protein
MGESVGSVFKGLGAAPGRAVGIAYVLPDTSDALDVPAGAILVVRLIHPYHSPLFFRIGAVVCEEGGLLQHAATLAREFGVPAVLGLPEATAIFRTGERLEVRGDAGEVIRLED